MIALELAGEESFLASPERLFATLVDLDALARIIPDLTSSTRVSDAQLDCVVRPGFSFLRGTLRLSIRLGQVESPRRAEMAVSAQGIGVSMQVASRLAIAPEAAGSRLNWQASVDELKGLVASVSPALVRAAADQVIRHAWRQVRKELGEA